MLWYMHRFYHILVVFDVVLMQQKRAQKGIQPKWNMLHCIYSVKHISSINTTVSNVVGMCSAA